VPCFFLNSTNKKKNGWQQKRVAPFCYIAEGSIDSLAWIPHKLPDESLPSLEFVYGFSLDRVEHRIRLSIACCTDSLVVLVGMRKMRPAQSGLLRPLDRNVVRIIARHVHLYRACAEWYE